MFDRRRFLAAGLAAPAFLGACGNGATAPATAAGKGDYAAARAGFHTKLLRNGPSAAAPMPDPPAGVERTEYKSGELSLAAWFKRPAGDAAVPAVLFLHGGFAFGGEDWDMASPYLDAGFAVMTPILRGEDGQAGVYSLFYDEVDDVLAAADHLASQPGVDGSKLFVAGHSVGGTMTMLAAMASDRFRGAASFSGSPDQVKFIKGGMSSEEIPFDTSDPREFEMRSPLSWPGSFKAPARLFYGSQESFFSDTTPRLAQAAKAAGGDVVAQDFPGDHFGAVPAERAASIAFFRQVAAP